MGNLNWKSRNVRSRTSHGTKGEVKVEVGQEVGRSSSFQLNDAEVAERHSV